MKWSRVEVVVNNITDLNILDGSPDSYRFFCGFLKKNAQDSTMRTKSNSSLNQSSKAFEYSSIKSFYDETERRYYARNNLMRAYFDHNYTHPELKYNPKPVNVFKIGLFFRKWPLHIGSTLVVPIRYFLNNGLDGYIGFLCIDSQSRNMLGSRYAPELAAAYADAIYTVLETSRKKELI